MRNLTHKNKRVVVTGLGCVTALGIGWETFWENLLAGKSGISRIEAFDTSEYERHYAGEVKDFHPGRFMNKKRVAQMGRAAQLAVVASRLALEDARFKSKDLNPQRTGVCIGTTMGEPQIMEQYNRRRIASGHDDVDTQKVLSYPATCISSNVSFEFKFKNRNVMFSNACSAGNYSVGYSYDLIKNDWADVMLAGGSDAFSRIAFTGFNRLFAMAPEKCQPFDKERMGMILGEGAGVLVMESLQSARERGARIYAEILGYGLSCDARHMTAPNIKGLCLVFSRAMENSGIKKDDVDYISAHGTGTKENDKAETEAFYRVFGKRAKKIPVSSIKSMLGHSMGAAAAIEAVACCLTVQEGKIPPTINYNKKDPECDIDCVANVAREQKVTVALNNSQAFGGNNACVAFRAVRQ